MKLKFIPIKDREKYVCSICSTPRSVKYMVNHVNPKTGELRVNDVVCNKCASIHSDEFIDYNEFK